MAGAGCAMFCYAVILTIVVHVPCASIGQKCPALSPRLGTGTLFTRRSGGRCAEQVSAAYMQCFVVVRLRAGLFTLRCVFLVAVGSVLHCRTQALPFISFAVPRLFCATAWGCISACLRHRHLMSPMCMHPVPCVS